MTVVSLERVKKSYLLGKTTVHALNGIDLNVEKGEFLVLKGQSGSGKSTTLNMIGAMDLPTSGEVTIADEKVSASSDYDLSMIRRKHIGFVFQSFNLIPVLNALENVAYPLRLQKVNTYKELAEEALERVGLKEFTRHRPSELSGGQIQRVAVARGIVSKPDIILADEPTANLDSTTSNQILDLMLELNDKHGLTFVVSTHHPIVIERATRVVELRDGVIVSTN